MESEIPSENEKGMKKVVIAEGSSENEKRMKKLVIRGRRKWTGESAWYAIDVEKEECQVMDWVQPIPLDLPASAAVSNYGTKVYVIGGVKSDSDDTYANSVTNKVFYHNNLFDTSHHNDWVEAMPMINNAISAMAYACDDVLLAINREAEVLLLFIYYNC